MRTVSVLIQTHNEEKNIKECINSAKLLTHNIVVLDMESTDNTVVIAKNNDAQVYSFPYSHYVEPAREFGIKKTSTDWVMILDADERMTKELAEEILTIINNQYPITNKESKTTYYKIPRKNMFNGVKWLKHGGWWPDHQIRLINTKAFITWPNKIHSTPKISGNMDYLINPFLHLFHGDITSMVQKTILFEGIESELLYQANKPVSLFTFFRKFFGELWRRLFKQAGFLDGEIGIIESVYQAFSKTITYLFLYEKKRRAL